MQKTEWKILAIGNSFSQDAAKYLQPMAQSAGRDLNIVNLYIGGCPLEHHWNNASNDAPLYDHERNGAEADCKCSIRQALQEDGWDVVTLQQASGDSGVKESYEPYLRELSAYVKGLAPQAAQWIHQTWAYESDSTHPHFSRYDGQEGMYQALRKCYSEAASEIGAKIIPVGDVIQTLRGKKPFLYAEGGYSLCRDGFHLSLDYGRYAAAATWLYKLTGILPDESFRPFEGNTAETDVLAMIRSTIPSVCDAEQ